MINKREIIINFFINNKELIKYKSKYKSELDIVQVCINSM